jgi:hypothetical protein
MVSRPVALMLAAAAVAVWVSAPSLGADPVSSAFDGTYAGRSILQAHLSKPGCPAGADHKLVIDRGFFRGGVVGFVTSDGFFTGRYGAGTREAALFEGRVDGPSLLGAVVTHQGDCVWMLKLERE